MSKIFALNLMIFTFLLVDANARVGVGTRFPKIRLKQLVKNLDLPAKITLKNKVIIYTFFTSWGKRSDKGLEFFNQVQKKYGVQNLVVVAINVDEDKKAGKSFLEGKKLNFPVLYDEKAKLTQKIKVPNLPRTYIINRKGIIVYARNGYYSDEFESFSEQIEKIIK